MEENIQTAYYRSPIGLIKIIGTNDMINSVDFTSGDKDDGKNVSASNAIKKCISQLDEYFNEKRKTFSLDYSLKGTDFQKKVWNEMVKIPFGTVVSYKNIAISIGHAKAVRAVGSAVGKNPLSIIIPCHRVVRSDGLIGNYSGGKSRKSWLLEHEKINITHLEQFGL